MPSAPHFRAAYEDLERTFCTRGAATALNDFMSSLLGTNWRDVSERLAPGEVARLERDAAAFFGNDLPALMEWHWDSGRAARITAPVLFVRGSASGPWFSEVQEWVSGMLPQAEVHLIKGAGHDLAMTHPTQFATIMADFLARHVP